MVQVGAACDAPRQMLGDERRLEALDQPCQPLEMRGVEPLGAAERQPDAVDRQRIVGAQPLQAPHGRSAPHVAEVVATRPGIAWLEVQDRKSTRLNSSHGYISYAVFCLKKKKNTHTQNADV